MYCSATGQASEIALDYSYHRFFICPRFFFLAIMSTIKGQFSFFNLENHLDKIYQINDFLLKLNVLIDWEIFRETLNIVRDKDRKSNAGRPPFDVMLMLPQPSADGGAKREQSREVEGAKSG